MSIDCNFDWRKACGNSLGRGIEYASGAHGEASRASIYGQLIKGGQQHCVVFYSRIWAALAAVRGSRNSRGSEACLGLTDGSFSTHTRTDEFAVDAGGPRHD